MFNYNIIYVKLVSTPFRGVIVLFLGSCISISAGYISFQISSTQLTLTCSKSTIETLEKEVRYVQS